VPGFGFNLPFWFLVLASGSLAMLYRIRWPLQYNHRTLFIATTFFAVVLGMIAWLDRAWIGSEDKADRNLKKFSTNTQIGKCRQDCRSRKRRLTRILRRQRRMTSSWRCRIHNRKYGRLPATPPAVKKRDLAIAAARAGYDDAALAS
jgi:hypothetical protein